MPRPAMPIDMAEAVDSSALYKHERKRRPQMIGVGTRGDAPAWLREGARAYYDRIMEDMEAAGTLSVIDAKVAALIANAELEMAEAQAVIDAEGMVVEGSTGQIRPHPLIKVRQDAQVRMARLLREIGLTPSARASLAIPMSPECVADEDDDEGTALR